MRRFFAFLLAVSLAAPGVACLWDYDTLQMERERFPGALELIVGKFLRHSDRFYEWRVKDRRGKVAAHESGEKKISDEQLAHAYDDLAVALDKLGKHDEAIAAIREKAERLPKVGEYETHANLGTFLVHSGRLEEGVAELKRAVEINPEAHFGREKYQIALVEYVMEQQSIPRTPLDARSPNSGWAHRHTNFAVWLLEHQKTDVMNEKTGEQAERSEIERATKGVLGMMRFGDYRSPVLLESLGDLLTHRSNVWVNVESNGQRLAARAYLRAAELTNDTRDKTRLRRKFEIAALTQPADTESGEMVGGHSYGREGISSTQLEDQLHREVKEADDWFAGVAYDEELWVEKSADPDAKFWGKYGGQEIRVGHDRLPAGKFAMKGLPTPIVVALAIGAVGMAGALAGAIAWRRRRPTGYDAAGRESVGRT